MGAATQSDQYDGVNRLSRVDESGGSQVWHQLFSYDEYGNRAVVSGANTFMPYSYQTPVVSALTEPLPFAGNRWTDSTLTSDAVGNQSQITYRDTHGTYTETYDYDAENRLKQSTTRAGTATYEYDAEGHRAKKTTSAGTEACQRDECGNGHNYLQILARR